MATNYKVNWSGMMYSFFTGALVGAGLALLFAPMSGKETRHAIVHEFDELKEKLVKLEEKLHKVSEKNTIESDDEDFM